jgi:hypothetical protein
MTTTTSTETTPTTEVSYAVYARPHEAAVVVAEHLNLPLVEFAPLPNAIGEYETRLVIVADSPTAAHSVATLVGFQPIAAIVAWRLSAEPARVLFRLPVPVFHGAVSRGEFDLAMSGHWDSEARRLSNERIAELETIFFESALRIEDTTNA